MSETVSFKANQDYSIYVIASSSAMRYQLEQPTSQFFINCVVTIRYMSLDTTIVCNNLDGYKYERSFEFPPDSLKFDDISTMIFDMNIPFPMENLHWNFGKSATKLESQNDVIQHILDLAHQTVNEHGCDNVIKINLRIVKRITLSHDEYEAMYRSMVAKKHEKREKQLSMEILLQEARLDGDYYEDFVKTLFGLHRRRVSKGSTNLNELGLKVLRAKESVSDCNSKNVCSICMDELETQLFVIGMPCSHIFHPKCIIKWLQRNPVCPNCRIKLPVD